MPRITLRQLFVMRERELRTTRSNLKSMFSQCLCSSRSLVLILFRSPVFPCLAPVLTCFGGLLFMVGQRLETLGHVAKASLRQYEVYSDRLCQGRADLIGVIGEENYLCFREQPFQHCRRFDPIHNRHPEVQQDEVWFQYLRLLDGIQAVSSFPANSETCFLAGALKEVSDDGQHFGAVIDNEDAGHLGYFICESKGNQLKGRKRFWPFCFLSNSR
jgi:hypothetical protein